MTRRQQWRTGLGAAGMVVGLAGMALEWRPLVWAAVAVLGLAVLLRLADHRRGEPATPADR